ncbi:sortase-associated OmpA-like protein PdsO [uncultured Shewanella sp.]|uniref:sortase-associated OmpA-like protein PdsO n=1 Tax=uncultured Shewanella sp. TaxID=173975 RepID=UPI00261F5152|nr:sortase-associated OmpA-like protein PdsO [uncultured Shewanella sp.]
MKKNVITWLLVGIINVSQINVSVAREDNFHKTLPTETAQEGTWIGLGSGIVVGAAVGGPLGAIIGAFTGGLIGKSTDKQTALEDKQLQLAQSRAEIERLEQKHAVFLAKQEQYEKAEQVLSMLSVGLTVQFKTGSSEIEAHFKTQLQEVASVMQLSPQWVITLTGYADRQGNNDFNQALSEQRVAEVMQYLERQGVDESRLVTVAFGDRFPVAEKASLENNVFDRRVTLQLEPLLVQE